MDIPKCHKKFMELKCVIAESMGAFGADKPKMFFQCKSCGRIHLRILSIRDEVYMEEQPDEG